MLSSRSCWCCECDTSVYGEQNAAPPARGSRLRGAVCDAVIDSSSLVTNSELQQQEDVFFMELLVIVILTALALMTETV
ncbi:hypothetical protein MPTK1_8g13900 [Marchantia polymorpha subsp. ruderalis]|uniref:Uncharacterized protein n=1 Tax=Marchantia polymorpha TaxID=3197 RepID=A0A2R6WCU4_MARPO|nr:hypothetical protein MARPO_0108s0014 [Marchantia polymorpha]BBN19817.1 hypothetical protein Mp_8g13900 [Marchantia polymorpha subsp. ruderalis]|eukprot:PTQ31665.1 hypothetical protein MARPO_0108s0014 [Marchantia polymorpha]